jgi:hypothetical protein
MSKETAIEWLIGELNGYDEDCEIFTIAKEMEREQILHAYREGRTDEQSPIEKYHSRTAAQHYNETYKENQ